MHLKLIVALCGIVIACAIQLCASQSIIGVNPKDFGLYRKGSKTFECFDGSKVIPIEYINDEYCDCADGSDEPGTPGCSHLHTKFYCANVGFVSKNIWTSMVNDGICDCCDGSDEYNGAVYCKNNCREQGSELRKAKADLLEATKAGAKVKAEYVEKAKKDFAEKEKRLEQIKIRIAELEPAIAEAEASNSKQEKLEQLEKDALRLQLEAQQQQKQQQEAPAATEAAAEAEAPEAVPPPPAAPVVNDEVHRAVDEHKRPEAETTREELSKLRSELTSINNEKSEIERTLSQDYGLDRAFYALKGQCFNLETREYTYELCPFDKTSQKDKNSHSTTSLGTWESWDNATPSIMKFGSGTHCWQGPARSTAVEVRCSATNEVTKVDEPSRCAYSMIFLTPAACDESLIAKLTEELAD